MLERERIEGDYEEYRITLRVQERGRGGGGEKEERRKGEGKQSKQRYSSLY